MQTWLVCFLLWSTVLLVNYASESATPEDGVGSVAGRLLGAAGLALLAWPIRLLLRLFPERSPHSLVRFYRRGLLGLLCGPIPLLLVLAFRATRTQVEPDQASFFLVMGLLMGFLVGLVDSIQRDGEP